LSSVAVLAGPWGLIYILLRVFMERAVVVPADIEGKRCDDCSNSCTPLVQSD
jgi:hypothetical protein